MFDYFKNNWEVYRCFDVPPTNIAAGTDCPRYATPCLPMKLVAGACVKIDNDETHLVNAIAGSAAAGGALTSKSPCHAWVCAFLLGGVWNNTKERMDKRHWALLQLFQHDNPDKTELHLAPFDGFKFSMVDPPAANAVFNVASISARIAAFVNDRSPTSINSAYAAVVR
eukprot:6187747-Pleurochrysis_carterae.AAC.1